MSHRRQGDKGDRFPLRAISDCMREDYRLQVVSAALSHYRDKNGDALARSELERAMQETVRLKGFRRPHLAISSPKAEELYVESAVAFHYYSKMAGAVLRLWVESRPDLADDLRAFAASRGMELRSAFEGVGFDGPAPANAARILDDFRTSRPGADSDDAILMFCCLSGFLPGGCPDGLSSSGDSAASDMRPSEVGVTRVTQAPKETMSKLKWAELLAELERLPPDAAEWDEGAVSDFTESVRRIASAKLAEREHGREELRDALSLLVSRHGERLGLFEVHEGSSWDAGSRPASEAPGLLEHVRRLHALLDHYAGVGQDPPATVRERRSLEDEILALHGTLDAAFAPTRSNAAHVYDVGAGDLPALAADGPAPAGSVLDESTRVEEGRGAQPAADGVDLSQPDANSNLRSDGRSDVEPPTTPPSVDIGVDGGQRVGLETPVSDNGDEIEKVVLKAPESPEVVPEPVIPPVAVSEDETVGNDTVVPAGTTPEEVTLQAKKRQEKGVTGGQHEDGVGSNDGHVGAAGEGVIIVPDAPVSSETAGRGAGTPEDAESNTAVGDARVGGRADIKVTRGPEASLAGAYPREFLWGLVAGGDLAGAYWYAQSVAARGGEPPVLPDVLAAVQGSSIIKGAEDVTARELFEIVAESGPSSGDVETSLRLAASLVPSLVAPMTSGMELWLEAPPGLEAFVELLKGFTKHRISLRVSDSTHIAGGDRRVEDFKKVTEAAQAWLANAASGRTQHKRSSDVRAHLARNELRQLLEPVVQDRRSSVEKVRRLAGQWSDRRFIVGQISRIDRELIGLKVSQITGNPREQIVREVEEACEMALRWCELVGREALIETRGDWVFEQVAALRAGLRELKPDVDAALGALLAPGRPAGLRAAATCLRRSVARVYDLLQIESDVAEVNADGLNGWLLRGAAGLRQVLLRRLKLAPGVAVDDEGAPSAGGETVIADALLEAAGAEDPLLAAVEGWLTRQDFRFVQELVEFAELEGYPEGDSLKRRCREGLAGSREALREARAKTSDEVEQAIVDGIIADTRSGYSARLEKIAPDQILNFAPAFAELESIRDGLKAERGKRKAKQESDWNSLGEALSTARLTEAERARVEEMMGAVLARGDTRVADEYLADLREVLDGNKELSANWFTPPAERDVFAEFLDGLPRIESWLQERQGLADVISEVKAGRQGAGMDFGALPPDRLEEAAAALDAWRQLRRLGAAASDRAVIPHVSTLLGGFLGFNPTEPTPEFLRVGGRGRDSIYLEAAVTSGTMSPVPHFGSRDKGALAVVCLWERPSADTVVALIRDMRLAGRSVLLFYVGKLGQRLSQRQRGEMSQASRRENLSLAVLDETLLVYLAGEAEARLPIFLRCALPFSAVNPYTPHQAGDVPPEMFFGRELMARDLQEPGGSCLVYGGRQFGKSALLRHVEREFHHPDNERYAWVEDINVVGDPKGGRATDTVWRRLRDRFREARLLDPHTSTDDPDAIYEKISDAMRQERRRVLVLFDEADHFLDADSKDGFKVVSDLRRLMTESGRRFKVVFAGLHNVYRFQGIPNQPLAHFGTPICVGPLEAAAAQALITRPLRALGYGFADGAGVLRILSYTNYHPGLIQLFCWELLRKLRAQGGDPLPPYRIDQSDVESVYRIQSLRDDIRDRFDWTLALDHHYQAIAWRLIYEQMADRDNFARAFSHREILRLARDAWAKGFADVGDDALHGLLEEMCGLGVLVRTQEGEYRLRSPNLVRLMGSEMKVLADLVSLSEEEPEVTFDADSHHMLLDEQSHRYSPLTHAQERGLAPPKFGAGLVFGSDALGITDVPESLRKLIPEGAPQGTWLCEEVPGEQDTPALLSKWLDQCLVRNSAKRRFVVWLRVKGSSRDAAKLVEAAASFCRKREGRNRWMRVFFIFDPAASWGWYLLPADRRIDLEGRVGPGAVTSPKRWNILGVAQRLKQMELLDTKQVCEGVFASTGGWPCLLDHLFARFKDGLDPRGGAEYMRKALAPGGELAATFASALGAGSVDPAMRVLRFVSKEGGVPVDLIDPQMITDGGPPISPKECSAALEFLARMGCVDVRADVAFVAPLVEGALLTS